MRPAKSSDADGTNRVLWVIFVLLSVSLPCDAFASPTFDGPPTVESQDGSHQLSWGEVLGEYEVQLHGGTDIRTVYSGRLPSAHVSGLTDGRYEFRVRAREDDHWSGWSEAKVLVVRHHPMSLVWTLLGLGALVFVGTVAVVVHGGRSAQ